MPGERQSVRLPADVHSLGEARSFLRTAAVQAGIDEARLLELDLVIEELLVNIARYAYGQDGSGDFEIACAPAAPGRLEVEISDEGAAFDPVAVPAPDLDADLAQRSVGGLGIFLVKSLVHSLTYRRHEGRSIISFEFPAA